MEERISHLGATNDSPTPLGQATVLSATVGTGSNVDLVWDLGDGTVDTGARISHQYKELGVYTAVVTASSETRFECTEITDLLPMDRTRGIMLWDWGPTVEEVDLYLRNRTDREVPAELTLSFYRRRQKWKEGHGGKKPAHVAGPANRMEWGSDTTIERFRPVAGTGAGIAETAQSGGSQVPFPVSELLYLYEQPAFRGGSGQEARRGAP